MKFLYAWDKATVISILFFAVIDCAFADLKSKDASDKENIVRSCSAEISAKKTSTPIETLLEADPASLTPP